LACPSPLTDSTAWHYQVSFGIADIYLQSWQVSASSGLNHPGRNRFLPVFAKRDTTTAALK